MSVLKITCSNDNIPERKYIINTLLSEFLGIYCEISFNVNCKSYELSFEEKIIKFADAFFSNYRDGCSYISYKNLPKNIKFVQSDLVEKPIPIIYGNDNLIVKKDEIKCGLDIFASSYFMLSRWEEYVIPKNNNLERVDEFKLWAVKNKVHNRAIVNEYVEFLRILLDKIGVPIPNKNHFEVMLTHDVDWCYLSTIKTLIKNLKSMVFKKNLYKKAFLIFCRYFYYKITGNNPFTSFD